MTGNSALILALVCGLAAQSALSALSRSTRDARNAGIETRSLAPQPGRPDGYFDDARQRLADSEQWRRGQFYRVWS